MDQVLYSWYKADMFTRELIGFTRELARQVIVVYFSNSLVNMLTESLANMLAG